MTIFFPDISSYEHGLTIQPGTVAVIAKATEGTYYRDAEYESFKAQATRVGAIFSAYHFLKAGNASAQANYCYAMVGSTPVMLDVETEGASKPTVTDCAAFIARMRQLGGRVWGAYFPRWYWEQVGGDLGSLGVAIVSSAYTAYSETGIGWQPYGGAAPAIWQYTDAQSYGGQTVDFNAYRSSVAQLAALITDTTTGASDVTPDEIAAVAAAVYEHGEESVTINGQVMKNVPLGNLAHGAWVSTNDPNGPVLSALNTIKSQVNDLFHRPVVQPVDVAALEQFIVEHQSAGTSAADLAAALVEHLQLTVSAK